MSPGTVGRNDPCPCGSGKKYKKCCIGKEPVARDSAPPPPRPDWTDLSRAEHAKFEEEVRRLDDLSNGALDAIEGKRYEDAERLCDDLLREYPQMVDGHDRLGMLREAQGRFAEAAEHYAKVLAIIEEEPDRHGPEMANLFRQRRDEALRRARSPA